MTENQQALIAIGIGILGANLYITYMIWRDKDLYKLLLKTNLHSVVIMIIMGLIVYLIH